MTHLPHLSGCGLPVIAEVVHGAVGSSRGDSAAQPQAQPATGAVQCMPAVGCFGGNAGMLCGVNGGLVEGGRCDAWDNMAELDEMLAWFSAQGNDVIEGETQEEDDLESCFLDIFDEPSSSSSSFSSLCTPASYLSSSSSAYSMPFSSPFCATTPMDMLASHQLLREEMTKEQQRIYRQRSKARWLEKRKRRVANASKTHYMDRRNAAKGRKRVGGKFAREGRVFMTMEERERLEAEIGAPAA